MNNEKILNLSDVDAEDFEAIKAAIEDWKACGLSGKFGFLSEKETQECMDALKKAFDDAYNRGAMKGGLAALAGVWVGAGIYKGYQYFKAKKEEKVE